MTDNRKPPDFAFGSDVWPGVAKLNEEAGEVVQVVGKLMMTGGKVEHWDGTDLGVRLLEEMADVAAAIDFVMQMNPQLSSVEFEARKDAKWRQFYSWHFAARRKVQP